VWPRIHLRKPETMAREMKIVTCKRRACTTSFIQSPTEGYTKTFLKAISMYQIIFVWNATSSLRVGASHREQRQADSRL